jgi:hypothetical protein
MLNWNLDDGQKSSENYPWNKKVQDQCLMSRRQLKKNNKKWNTISSLTFSRTPDSLKDSNVSPSRKQQKKEELGHTP